jgi:hypothetical protein
MGSVSGSVGRVREFFRRIFRHVTKPCGSSLPRLGIRDRGALSAPDRQTCFRRQLLPSLEKHRDC